MSALGSSPGGTSALVGLICDCPQRPHVHRWQCLLKNGKRQHDLTQQESSPVLKDALKNEILQSRALTYRRNVLALAVVLIALCWVVNVRFDDLSFFGVKLIQNGAGNRTVVLRVVVLLLLYHVLFFGYYAFRDMGNWLRDALEQSNPQEYRRRVLPEWQMLFRVAPTSKRWRAQPSGLTPTDWERVWNKENGELVIRPKMDGPRPTNGEYSYGVPITDFKKFRFRFLWFSIVDIGMPFALTLAALYAWLTG